MKKFNLILDSGAFSAWTKQTEVDLEAYIKFIMANDDCFDYAVGLDVIPSSFGAKSVSALEQEEAAKRGWSNYLTTMERGVDASKVIHVFHQGENFKWLKKAISKMDYVGLSPANDCPTKSKINWLDECMKYVCTNGTPDVKFHGFGVTSMEIMHRYPWYSVDSSSWVTFSRYGTILVPHMNPQGKYIYNKPPHTIQVTRRAPTRKEDSLKHFDNLPGEMQKAVVRYVSSKGFLMGKSVMKDGKEIVYRDGVMTHHRLRDLLNLMFYIDAGISSNCNFYIAGNFPQMKDPELEIECFLKVCEKNDNVYNRLVSFWFRDDCETVMGVKREMINHERKKTNSTQKNMG